MAFDEKLRTKHNLAPNPKPIFEKNWGKGLDTPILRGHSARKKANVNQPES